MSAYRLDPIITTLSDDIWNLSATREAIWVGADSPGKARERAALRTMVVRPAIGNQTKTYSPWLQEKYATCVWYPSKTDISDGSVVTLSGQKIS